MFDDDGGGWKLMKHSFIHVRLVQGILNFGKLVEHVHLKLLGLDCAVDGTENHFGTFPWLQLD